MLCDTRPARPGSRAAQRQAAQEPGCDALEERRREIKALLDEIRAPSPRPADIVRTGQDAAVGGLGDGRPDRSEAPVAAPGRAG